MSEIIIDSAAAKKLAILCFNKTWDYIDIANKNDDEIRNMILEAHASLWFWINYKEHTQTNISIGYWQLSRVYALAKDGQMAKLFSEKCIEISKSDSVDSFYLSYGYEALARALILLDQKNEARNQIELGKKNLEKSKEKELDGLLNDFKELEVRL